MIATARGVSVLLLSLFGCPKEQELPELDPPEELVIPDLSGVDLEALYVEALELAISSDVRVPWRGHLGTLDRLTPGCPDVYAGTFDIETDALDDDAPGLSWYDYCNAGDLRFGGFQYWEGSVQADGDLDSAEGLTTIGERKLQGDGVVGQGSAVLFEFDGVATDAITVNEAAGYSRWTYSSLVDGTVTGSSAFDGASETPGGWRTDMYLFYTGGDVDLLEARGNIYLFERRLQTRFDSVAIDIEFVGPSGATPEDCAIEPRGWIGVRAENAWWYDLVFEPRFDEEGTGEPYENDPYTACDGCGTLYVRGIAQEGVQVCPDLSFLWAGALVPPDPTEFALSIRDALEDR